MPEEVNPSPPGRFQSGWERQEAKMSLGVVSHTLRKRNAVAAADHTHRIDGSPAANRRESQLSLHFLCVYTRLPLDQRELGCGGTQPLPGRREEGGSWAEDVLRGLCFRTDSDGRIDGHLSVDGLGLRKQMSPFSIPLSSRLKGIDFAL